MVTAAVDKDLIKKNPCHRFVLKNDNMTLQKEILLSEEIQQLMATHSNGMDSFPYPCFVSKFHAVVVIEGISMEQCVGQYFVSDGHVAGIAVGR